MHVAQIVFKGLRMMIWNMLKCFSYFSNLCIVKTIILCNC